MSTTVDALYQEALHLSDDSRIALAERLIESVELEPDMLEAHLVIVRHRLKELESGASKPVPGPEALRQVREAVAEHSKA